jgi:hypothetical protein
MIAGCMYHFTKRQLNKGRQIYNKLSSIIFLTKLGLLLKYNYNIRIRSICGLHKYSIQVCGVINV